MLTPQQRSLAKHTLGKMPTSAGSAVIKLTSRSLLPICYYDQRAAARAAASVSLRSLYNTLIGLSLKADSAGRPLLRPPNTIAIPTCIQTAPAHAVIGDCPGLMQHFEGACFTSRCFGGWIPLALHVRPDQMTRPCGRSGWRVQPSGPPNSNSAEKLRFLFEFCILLTVEEFVIKEKLEEFVIKEKLCSVCVTGTLLVKVVIPNV